MIVLWGGWDLSCQRGFVGGGSGLDRDGLSVGDVGMSCAWAIFYWYANCKWDGSKGEVG